MRLAATAAAMLLATACGGGADVARAAELECQRRLAAAFNGPAGPDVGGGFEALRDRLAALPTEGCNEDQRHTAERLAGLAGRIAATMRDIGDVRAAMEQQPSLRTDRRFGELMAMIEQFDRRRAILVDDLRRMEAEAR